MSSELIIPRGVDTDYAAELLCPECGCNNLHQVAYFIYERREDAEESHLIKVLTSETEMGGPRKVVSTHSMVPSKDNPSARRQGMRIRFSCEQCHGYKILSVVQHKGTTYVEWEDI